MSGDKRMDTPMNRVLGMGAAGEGASHWWAQKISSVALLILSALFVIPFGAVIGDGYEAVRALYANPLNALIAILFTITVFWHLAQGLQVVIEDYVHDKWPRTMLLLANSLGCAALGVAGVFAILKLAFAG